MRLFALCFLALTTTSLFGMQNKPPKWLLEAKKIYEKEKNPAYFGVHCFDNERIHDASKIETKQLKKLCKKIESTQSIATYHTYLSDQMETMLQNLGVFQACCVVTWWSPCLIYLWYNQMIVTYEHYEKYGKTIIKELKRYDLI